MGNKRYTPTAKYLTIMCYNNSIRFLRTTSEVSVKSSCCLPLNRTTFPGRLRLPALLSCAGALFLVAALQAQDSGLQARQVYYKPQTAPKPDQNVDSGQKPDKNIPGDTNPKSTGKRTTPKKTTKPNDTGPVSNDHTVKVEPAPLGLKYVIEQEQASGGPVQVDPDKVFATGDGIRLRIEVNSDAYVYLVTRGSSGQWTVLFPEPGEDNHLKAYQPVQVPAAPADPIAFEEPAGKETLYIRVSRTPVTDLQKLLPAKPAQGQQLMAVAVPKPQIDDMLRAERMQTRDLARGKVHPVENANPEDKNEWAFYTVNVSTTPGAQVVQKFDLRHK
jgi:Domain of unknown function (DUF4384)